MGESPADTGNRRDYASAFRVILRPPKDRFGGIMYLGRTVLVSIFVMTSHVALASTYVYVGAAGDGTVGRYTLETNGTLKLGETVELGPPKSPSTPMAVSPDKHFLFAAVRTKPFSVVTFGIDKQTGALKKLSNGPSAHSLVYLSLDKEGHHLLGASYPGGLVSTHPVAKDGQVGEPSQVLPTARFAHSIITDRTNHWAFAPHLGADQIFQFKFDAKTGKLTPNSPAMLQLKAGSGPRHIVMSNDNKFAYLLSEMNGTITTLALDAKTGLLSEVSAVSMLPVDSKLVPGIAHMPQGEPPGPAHDSSNDICASDLHLTPNGKFLYAAERTSSTINTFSVDAKTGKLTRLAGTPTEKWPRSFAIDPEGKYLIAAGQQSDSISVYSIDSAGALRLTAQAPTGKGANWVEIVSLPSPPQRGAGPRG